MEHPERRDDYLLIELGEILRLSIDAASLQTAVTAALVAHFGLARCLFTTLDDAALSGEDRAQATDGRLVARPSYVVVPLLRDRATAAVLYAAVDEPRALGSTDVALIGEVAERTWLWIERERLVAELSLAKEMLENRVAERTRDLNRSLAEKTILLREIHHRVKNNLQVVSSLLSLQRARIADPVARAILEDSQTRVRSMALVHEQLYRSKDLASVAFATYVRELVGQLWDSLGARERGIVAEIAIEDVALPIDQAIPCGLILNELITNALKHASPRTIRVELVRATDRFRLIVQDDGIGIPEGLSFSNATTFGMDMTATFVEQLDGAIELVRDEGTTVIVTFT